MSSSNQPFFPDLSKEAQIWITPVDGSAEALNKILDQTQAYLTRWTSHGRSIVSSAMLYSDRFLIVAGEIPGGNVSGCGIDALVHEIASIVRTYQAKILSPMFIFYRSQNGEVDYVTRGPFRGMLSQGVISHETHVFNTGIHTLAQLRGGEFERPLPASVYARLFRVPEAIS
ncbi:MAG: hypothetical protein OXF06_00375 [Bacteroidetes bacterium]|nr:hypothetical protein [Bacteroidota bacterium]